MATPAVKELLLLWFSFLIVFTVVALGSDEVYLSVYVLHITELTDGGADISMRRHLGQFVSLLGRRLTPNM